jgi:hypothetical protein
MGERTELRFRQVHMDFHTSENIGGVGAISIRRSSRRPWSGRG